ncbi:MAG: GIY-YIG nuclease family protein [Pseudohongiellaceae bacterium]
MGELSNKEILDTLGVETQTKKKAAHTAREERIIAGFEEIQRFVEENGHLPQHGEDKDIFERIYATRLEQIRRLKECRELLIGLDHQELLDEQTPELESQAKEMTDEELLAELGADPVRDGDVRTLRHVKPRAEINAAEEIANRTLCKEFEKFKPVFEAVQNELDSGIRHTVSFKDDATVEQGNLFILSGQKVYVASKGEEFRNRNDKIDSRLRVIYDNGTESDILMRSLQRALNKDEKGRRITNPNAGPLFEGTQEQDDQASGTIYVLRSKSSHPLVKEHGKVLHKIGVTGGDIRKRIANAAHDPTFLMADVEIVATYDLYNINRAKLENIIHRFFEPARLEIEITDRFGKPVVPREWFIAPLFIIDETVEKIREGTIGDFRYDVENVQLVER